MEYNHSLGSQARLEYILGRVRQLLHEEVSVSDESKRKELNTQREKKNIYKNMYWKMKMTDVVTDDPWKDLRHLSPV